jgi:hypothetical protein
MKRKAKRKENEELHFRTEKANRSSTASYCPRKFGAGC